LGSKILQRLIIASNDEHVDRVSVDRVSVDRVRFVNLFSSVAARACLLLMNISCCYDHVSLAKTSLSVTCFKRSTNTVLWVHCRIRASNSDHSWYVASVIAGGGVPSIWVRTLYARNGVWMFNPCQEGNFLPIQRTDFGVDVSDRVSMVKKLFLVVCLWEI